MEGKFLQISDSSILAKKLTVRDFEITAEMGTPYIGVDWGFSVDQQPLLLSVMYLMNVCILETLQTRLV